jgi:predicted CXXCH cytochrome family protein
VGCHSTGFGQPGGFGELTAANVGRFKAVQCESCHGPMGGHPGNPVVTPYTITPEVCIGCHDSANSPDFDFEAYMRRATCQGGAPEVMPGPP